MTAPSPGPCARCLICGAIGELMEFSNGPEWVHRNGTMDGTTHSFQPEAYVPPAPSGEVKP